MSNHGNWRKTLPGEGYAQFGDGPLAQVRGSQSHPGIVEPLSPSTGKFVPPSNMTPLRVIHSAPQGATLATLGRPSGLAYDPKRKQILSPN